MGRCARRVAPVAALAALLPTPARDALDDWPPPEASPKAKAREPDQPALGLGGLLPPRA
jgi:hypothetical protein